MKSKIAIFFTLSLLAVLLLTGCGRNRLRSQGGAAPIDTGQPPAATQAAAAPTDSAIETPTAEATQAAPTDAAAEPALPTADSASDQELNKVANDLNTQLDGLFNDLGSTDTMNDVK